MKSMKMVISDKCNQEKTGVRRMFTGLKLELRKSGDEKLDQNES